VRREGKETRLELETLKDNHEALQGWITQRDTGYMDYIRIRHLVNCTQDRLAKQLQLEIPTSYKDGSIAWRQWVESFSIQNVAEGRALLQNITADCLRELLASDGAMSIIFELEKKHRLHGDRAAHPSNIIDPGGVRAAVNRIADENNRAEFMLMVNYVWP